MVCVVRCMVCVVCCVLCVVCCVLCCVLCVVCCVLCVVCGVWCVVCGVWCVVLYMVCSVCIYGLCIFTDVVLFHHQVRDNIRTMQITRPPPKYSTLYSRQVYSSVLVFSYKQLQHFTNTTQAELRCESHAPVTAVSPVIQATEGTQFVTVQVKDVPSCQHWWLL